MYKVIEKFSDFQDGGYIYEIGEVYPRKGVTATNERIKELSSSANQLKRPLIKFHRERKNK